MTAHIVPFPTRTVVIRKIPEGGWLVLGERGHGWLHGSRSSAIEDARWLARNLGLVVREVRHG
jgi:hypothetical protein